MTHRIFFTLWRLCLIAILGLALQQLYGWAPSGLIIFAIVGLAVDSVVTLLMFKE